MVGYAALLAQVPVTREESTTFKNLERAHFVQSLLFGPIHFSQVPSHDLHCLLTVRFLTKIERLVTSMYWSSAHDWTQLAPSSVSIYPS